MPAASTTVTTRGFMRQTSLIWAVVSGTASVVSLGAEVRRSSTRARQAISSAAMATPISAGLRAPISAPTGMRTRSMSAGATPLASSRARVRAALARLPTPPTNPKPWWSAHSITA